MKITAIDTCVLTVPTPKPMSSEFPHHKLTVAQITTDEGLSGLGYSLGGEVSIHPPAKVKAPKTSAPIALKVLSGIVVDAAADTFKTIEGNTNDDGSHEGYEVCARVRGYAGIDVVVMEAPLLKRERQGSGDCGTAVTIGRPRWVPALTR